MWFLALAGGILQTCAIFKYKADVRLTNADMEDSGE